jgi:hypothetical protein
LRVTMIIIRMMQVREVRLSACCMQTTAHLSVVLPHFMVAGGAEMTSDLLRHGSLSIRSRSECCATPQNLALTSHGPK